MTMGIVLLRFRHPTKDLTFYSSLLAMPCSRSWIAGAPRQTPTGNALPGTYSESYWTSRLEFPCESGFSEKILYIVDKLSKEEKNLRDHKASGGKIEIYLQLPGSINNGDTIESELLKKIGYLGIDLLVEIFPGT